MFAKSASWKSSIAEIFGQVDPQTWASHTKWSLAERAGTACYSETQTPSDWRRKQPKTNVRSKNGD